MMMFGREAELPVDLLYGLPPKQQPCIHTEYVVTLSERLDKIINGVGAGTAEKTI
jgi:hypothetical protein